MSAAIPGRHDHLACDEWSHRRAHVPDRVALVVPELILPVDTRKVGVPDRATEVVDRVVVPVVSGLLTKSLLLLGRDVVEVVMRVHEVLFEEFADLLGHVMVGNALAGFGLADLPLVFRATALVAIASVLRVLLTPHLVGVAGADDVAVVDLLGLRNLRGGGVGASHLFQILLSSGNIASYIIIAYTL